MCSSLLSRYDVTNKNRWEGEKISTKGPRSHAAKFQWPRATRCSVAVNTRRFNLQFHSLYSPFVLICNRFSKRDNRRLSIRGSRSGCRRDGRILGRFLFSKEVHHYLFSAIKYRLSVPLLYWNDGILSSAVLRSSLSFELSKSLTTVVSFCLLNEDEARTIWFFSSPNAVVVCRCSLGCCF